MTNLPRQFSTPTLPASVVQWQSATEAQHYASTTHK